MRRLGPGVFAIRVLDGVMASDEGCWSGGYTADICCDVRADPTVRASCWDAVFTHERCCLSPIASTTVPAISKSAPRTPLFDAPVSKDYRGAGASDPACWSGWYTEKVCCDTLADERVTASCWDEVFTRKRCCPVEVTTTDIVTTTSLRQPPSSTLLSFEGSRWAGSDDAGCLSGGYTADVLDVCCDTRVDAKTWNLCWQGPFTYERCCPSGGECWSESDGYTAENCCDLRMGPIGQEACWDGVTFTYEKCCVPPRHRRGQTHCESGFRKCDYCKAVLASPRFNREAWVLCSASGGSISVVFEAVRSIVICTPPKSGCAWESRVELMKTLKLETYLPSLDFQDCRPRWSLQTYIVMATLVLPFFCASWHWLCACAARAHLVGLATAGGNVDAVPAQRSRNGAVDLMRVLAVAVSFLEHDNIKPHFDGSQGWVYNPNVTYATRLVDLFTVISVVLALQNPPKGPTDFLDGLWRKLGRQLPIYLFPTYLLHNSFCVRVTSCQEVSTMEGPGESFTDVLWATVLFRYKAGPSRDSWAFQMDLRNHLVIQALLLLEHYGGPRALEAAVAALFAWFLAESRSPSYYGFLTFRLPMALLVLLLARGSRFFSWRHQWPRTWFVVVSGLLVLSFANCGLGGGRATENGHVECMADGWGFFFRGAAFHAGSVAICYSLGVPARMSAILAWLSDLSLPFLRFHRSIIGAVTKCERAGKGPWSYATDEDGFVTYVADDWLDRSAISHALFWLSRPVLCLAVSQIAVWIVQRPWSRCLSQVHSVVRRALSIIYIAAVLCDGYSRGYRDLITPTGDLRPWAFA